MRRSILDNSTLPIFENSTSTAKMSTTTSTTTKSSSSYYDLSPDNPLCLCEYVNQHGQRAHLLMCCCNCDAFDSLCTRLCCGDDHNNDTDENSSNQSSTSRWRLFLDVLADMYDRVRVPCPGGARPIDIDLVFALLTLLVYVYVGTHGFLATLAVVFTVPCCVYARFFSTRMGNNKSANTRLAFYMLALSLLIAFVVYNVSLADEIAHVSSTLERRLVNYGLVACLLGLVYLKNSDPGFIRPSASVRNTAAASSGVTLVHCLNP